MRTRRRGRDDKAGTEVVHGRPQNAHNWLRSDDREATYSYPRVGMRWGDWVLCVSIILNLASLLAYAWQGHWRNALYFLGAFVINTSLLGMK